MEKETFVNELDRLLAPYLETIADSPSEILRENEYWRSVLESDGLTVEVEEELVNHVYTRKISSGGVLVYERIGGRTEVCRPGQWVLIVLEHALSMQGKRERDRLNTALEKEIQRRDAFAPV